MDQPAAYEIKIQPQPLANGSPVVMSSISNGDESGTGQQHSFSDLLEKYLQKRFKAENNWVETLQDLEDHFLVGVCAYELDTKSEKHTVRMPKEICFAISNTKIIRKPDPGNIPEGNIESIKFKILSEIIDGENDLYEAADRLMNSDLGTNNAGKVIRDYDTEVDLHIPYKDGEKKCFRLNLARCLNRKAIFMTLRS